MRRAVIGFVVAMLSVAFTQACASSKTSDAPVLSSSTSTSAQGTPITDEMIGRGRGEMTLSVAASDRAYAFSEKSPVLVGGGFGEGSDRTYKYLNALRGAGGQKVSYTRIGTCCPFQSPNSPFGGNALLEVFEIGVPGASAPKRIYFNWYDEGETLIPVGLSAAR